MSPTNNPLALEDSHATSRSHLSWHHAKPVSRVFECRAGENHCPAWASIFSQTLPTTWRARGFRLLRRLAVRSARIHSARQNAAVRRRTGAWLPTRLRLCTEHEQHTCVGVLEITSSCNLSCPMCYAHSGPGGKHLSFDECTAAIDRLVETEGRPEVLQLSGGEPTIHPQFLEILDYGYRQPIDVVMINTNGIRFAHDPALVEAIAQVSAAGRRLFSIRRIRRSRQPSFARRTAVGNQSSRPSKTWAAPAFASRW